MVFGFLELQPHLREFTRISRRCRIASGSLWEHFSAQSFSSGLLAHLHVLRLICDRVAVM